MQILNLCIASLIALLSCQVTFAQDAPPSTQPFEFTRMVAHWVHYNRPDYLEFIRDADIHFVNYNRTEPPRQADGKPSAGDGAQDEKPIPVNGLRANLRLPSGRTPMSVSVISPEQPDPKSIAFEFADGRLRFTMPEFLVYGIARIRTVVPLSTHDPNLYLLVDDH